MQTADSRSDLIDALARNLAGGIRLSLLRDVKREHFSASAEAFAVLVVLDLLVMFALAFASVGVNGQFNYHELPRSLLFVPLTLLFGLLVVRASRESGSMLLLPTALVAAGAFVTLVLGIVGLVIQHEILPFPLRGYWNHLSLAGIAWWSLAVVAGVVRLVPSSLRQKVTSALAGLLLVVAPAWWFPQGYLWVPLYDAGGDARSRAGLWALAEERAFYAQHEALRHALDALEPERPGIADLYVLAAALYAREDVFMKEVQVIVDLFRSRFDAAGRTLALINNPKTVDEHPIASLTSLTTALHHVGQLMNTDEDVLVLYVSSHGTEKHHLSVEFWPLRLEAIDPAALKRALDESGIRWKVIVISACYSGGFVEPLQDEHALIITASSASRKSFGCGNESDSTYLAKALFDQELRKTHSFERAFDAARSSIVERERAQGFEPSEPQIFVGAAMREKWKEVERRLETGAQHRQLDAAQ